MTRLRIVLLVTAAAMLPACSPAGPAAAPAITAGPNTATSAPAASPTPAASVTAPPTPPPTTAPADNGVSALSGAQILAAAQSAIDRAHSYRMRGQAIAPGSISNIDISFVGKAFKGTATLNGQTVELILLDPYVYIRASDEYWKSALPPGSEDLLALLHGKYVKEYASDPSVSVANDMKALVSFHADGPVTKGSTTIKNGRSTIAISFPKVSETDSSLVTVTLYVATTGKPLPIRFERSDGEVANFDRYDSVPALSAPDPSEIFDLTAFPP